MLSAVTPQWIRDLKRPSGDTPGKMVSYFALSLPKAELQQLEEREALLGFWQDHDLVFPTRLGAPMSRHNLVNRGPSSRCFDAPGSQTSASTTCVTPAPP
jgi:hypothetical protein